MKGLFSVGVGLLLASLACGARAQVIPDVPVVEAMADYIAPGGMVAVDGARRIHLRCIGQGAPTVVFTAGLGAWSATWAKVQPEVAKVTRACAWDRAGFGLSDGDASHAQTVDQTTADLERALKGAGIKGPYVLVGHSAGAYETLAFADRHRQEVAGVVLVDPSRPHDLAREAAISPVAAKADRAYFAGEVQRLRDCATGVASGAIKTGAPAAPCFQYFPEIPKAVQATLAQRDADPARLRAQASLYAEYEANGERIAKAGRAYGELPLIVLSAARPYWPREAEADHAALTADWVESHKALAALSTRGERQVVTDTSHLIQLDQPQRVIEAVTRVVGARR